MIPSLILIGRKTEKVTLVEKAMMEAVVAVLIQE